MRFHAVVGVRLEPIGSMWAAWSPASGETHLLNDESAALLELLHEHPGLDTAAAAQALAAEVDAEGDLAPAIELAWLPLEWAGFVRRMDSADS